MADSLPGILFLLLYCLTLVEGEIRCYCNESWCISNNYMCKSTIGMCFSYASPQGKIIQGCVDNLIYEKRTMCLEQEDERTKGLKEKISLLCCRDDVCNYRQEISIIVTNQSNESENGGKTSSSSKNQGLSSDNSQHGKSPEKDLWFKAAVIAVPIAGGFILVLLVLLAVRMLRTDSRNHKRLVKIRRERSLTKAKLYVTDHFLDKEKTCSVFVDKQHSPNRDLKFKVDKHGKTYEKVSDCKNSDVPVKKSPYPSIIIWGKSKKCGDATIV